jgi:hypothetical protein
MEVLLFLFLLIQFLGQTQNQIAAKTSLDLEVLNFSCSHYRGGLVVSERREKGSPASRQRVYRQEIENRSSIENRSRDMKELEESVYRQAAEFNEKDTYKYNVELRNNGTKVIKWVFWDYQTSVPSAADNVSHRQFVCAVKIKPNNSESLNGWSSLPPSGVVNAADRLTERVYINRVEYTDGESWQRPDWLYPDRLPGRNTARGKCRPI